MLFSSIKWNSLVANEQQEIFATRNAWFNCACPFRVLKRVVVQIIFYWEENVGKLRVAFQVWETETVSQNTIETRFATIQCAWFLVNPLFSCLLSPCAFVLLLPFSSFLLPLFSQFLAPTFRPRPAALPPEDDAAKSDTDLVLVRRNIEYLVRMLSMIFYCRIISLPPSHNQFHSHTFQDKKDFESHLFSLIR